jgi:hypothetical protein
MCEMTEAFFDVSQRHLWPIFFVGIGFSTAAVVIAALYFVHQLRAIARKKIIPRWVAETMVLVLVFLPGGCALFGFAIMFSLAKKAGVTDDYLMFSVTFFGLIGLALYFNRLDTSSKK